MVCFYWLAATIQSMAKIGCQARWMDATTSASNSESETRTRYYRGMLFFNTPFSSRNLKYKLHCDVERRICGSFIKPDNCVQKEQYQSHALMNSLPALKAELKTQSTIWRFDFMTCRQEVNKHDSHTNLLISYRLLHGMQTCIEWYNWWLPMMADPAWYLQWNDNQLFSHSNYMWS